MGGYDGKVVIGTELDTKRFEAQISQLEDKLATLEEEYKIALKDTNFPEDEIKKYEVEIEQTKNKLVGLYKQQAKINSLGFSDAKGNLEGISDKMKDVIKNVKKWALAVFGIRSAYMAIRNAMNIISQGDEQLKADIEYIKNIIAYTLEPIVRAIVDVVKRILQYVAYIIRIWTGKNIFEDADKKLKSANKNANKLKKTLAGFDEINIIGENGKEGTGSVSPSFDLTNLDDVDMSAIYSWTDKVKKIVLNAFDNIGEKIKEYMRDLGFSEDFINAFDYSIQGIKIIFSGFLDFVKGILQTIVGIFTLDFNTIKEGIGNVFNGIYQIFIGFKVFVDGIFQQILTALYDLFLRPAEGSFKEKINNIKNWWKDLFNKVGDFSKNAFNSVKNAFSNVGNFLKGVLDKIKDTFGTIGAKVGESVRKAFVKVINDVLQHAEDVINTPIYAINKLIDVIKYVPGLGDLKGLDYIHLPRLAKGGIVNNPGNGVMMGNYIAGEKGAEAVIPLTDDTLQRLANMIPIEITLTNKLDGRIIGKEVVNITDRKNFIRNGA